MTAKVETLHHWKRTFFTIWTGQKLSWIGSALASFALVWWLTDLTGSATVLATGTLLSMLPPILLGPFAGALVDRWDRRAVMIVADSAIAGVSAWLAYLFWIEALQVWHVYVIMLARAIGSTFHQPAMSASTPLLVPEEHLPRVQGLDSTLAGAAGIVSPPLGALLIRLLPLHGIMAVDVFSAAFAIVPLFFVHIPRPQPRAASGGAQQAKPSLWADVREGVRFVWRWPGLRTLVLLPPLLKVTLMPALSLVPLLATRHFGGDAAQIAWLNSAWGIGMMVGGLTLSAWAGFRRRSVTSMMGVTGLGVGMLIAGLAPSTALWMAIGGMFLTGFMVPMADGPLMAILQTIVPPEMQGRVFTVVMSACNITTPIGMVIAGPVADRLGIPFYFLAAGLGSLATVLLALLSPSVMHIEENHRQGQVAAVPMQVGASADEYPATVTVAR